MAESLLAFTQSLSSNPFVLISENECSSADGIITLSNNLFIAFISIYYNRGDACAGAGAVGVNKSTTIPIIIKYYNGNTLSDSISVVTTANTITVNNGAYGVQFNYTAICFA